MRITWPTIDNRPVSRYSDVRYQLHTGDLVAVATDTRGPLASLRAPIARIIQRVTASPLNHIGILSRLSLHGMDRVLVLEAVAKGVQIAPLSYYVPGLEDGEPHVRDSRDKLLVLRPDWDDEDDATLALRWAWRQVLRGYDVGDLVKVLLWRLTGGIWVGPITPNRMVCSGLVGRAMMEGRIYIPPGNGKLWTPRDLAESPQVALLWRLV